MVKKSWNAEKKELWHLNTADLMEKLQQLKTQLMKEEMGSRGYSGDLRIPMHNERVSNTHEANFDLKGLRHKIACIKTMLHVKMLKGSKQ